MTRYAIYYVPHASTPLWRFGSSVLGFDAVTFKEIGHPDHPIFQDPRTSTLTAAPRRYGFHATLKAPFGLATDRDEAGLEGELQRFCHGRPGFPLRLKLEVLDGFFALVPSESSPEVARLAEDCVRIFDPFRAPMSAEDRERRRPERLSAREAEHLDRWGYPYVFEDFRFHMTLTGSMGFGDQIRFEPVLSALFGSIPPEVEIDAIALCRQEDRNARFRVVRRFAFTAA